MNPKKELLWSLWVVQSLGMTAWGFGGPGLLLGSGFPDSNALF